MIARQIDIDMPDKEIKEIPQDLLDYLMKHTDKPLPDRCSLCGDNRHVLGLFVPEDSPALGGVKNKQRVFIYALCKECVSKQPASAEKMEKILTFEIKQAKELIENAKPC